MAALEPQYMSILKKVLENRIVPLLPPLLGNVNPANQAAKQLSRAFSAFTLHKLLEIDLRTATSSVVDDNNDKGIDAIYYDAYSETLYLLQSKLKESEQFKQEDALPFCEGVRLLLKQDFTHFNENVIKRQTEIENALDSCSHIKLVIPYTGDGLSQTASDVLQALLDDENLDEERLDKQIQFYTATEITRDLLAEQAYKPVHTEIALQKHEKIENPRKTYYGVIKLTDLVALHKTHGKALYERNIRYFLGSGKSDVNKAIKTTLDNNPNEFFYLNNGVTAVCDLIEPKSTKQGVKKFKVLGLSIINGAQTVASSAEFVLQHPNNDISEAKVMLTIIQARSEGEFSRLITKARNHQNPVQTANFASLDENQERLRQEIAHLDYFYHYRPEEIVTSSDKKTLTLDEALRAIALLQNDPRFPVWIKNEPSRLTNPDSAEYQTLFSDKLAGIHLLNATLCYRIIRANIINNEQRTNGQERLIYRHGNQVIMATMMKRLRNKIYSVEVIKETNFIQLISQPLDQLRQDTYDLALNLLHGVGPLSYFRNQSNVVSFLSDLMEIHYGLTGDTAINHLRNINNPSDAYPRKRLMDYLSSHAPQL